MKKSNIINKKIRFECQGSSNCCISRESYGYVYLSKKDILRLSKFKNLKSNIFLNLFCEQTNGFTHLKEKNKNGKCLFLNKKKCSVYSARPTQCRTWPFWSENMNAKTWDQDISKFCPGVGKGKIISPKKIKEMMMDDEENEKDMLDM